MAVAATANEQKFFLDLAAHFNSMRPVYIVPESDEAIATLFGLGRPTSVFPYSDATSSKLSSIVMRNELDVLFFGQGVSNVTEMLLELHLGTGLLARPGVRVVLPVGQDTSALPLRLDTQLYKYEMTNASQSVGLHEHYKIKGIVSVERMIGKWSEKDGVLLDVPYIWQRRYVHVTKRKN